MSVIGCLEYDPSKPHPTRHRDYLAQVAKHREVVPFNNPQLLHKIHQTYQVMYIQEVILPTPSLFEENMMSALNSFVLFNKAEIINTIQVRGGWTECGVCLGRGERRGGEKGGKKDGGADKNSLMRI